MQIDYSVLREGYMWGYRPVSYFAPQPPLQKLLASVKGAKRRQYIEKLADEGRLEELPAEFVAESLNDEVRHALGRVHPILMGGEYLPDHLPGEIEIARVELNSLMCDVISVRARSTRKQIQYRIVDEHEQTFQCHPRSTLIPLAFEELVGMMDRCLKPGGLVLGYLERNLEWGSEPVDLHGFATARSVFYPELNAWYEAVAGAFLGAHEAERAANRNQEVVDCLAKARGKRTGRKRS